MKRRTLQVLLSLALLSASVVAQTPTGAIVGTVSDPTGAVVPNAKVNITERATGRVISVATNSEGNYDARNLLPGLYDVRVEMPGFAAKDMREITVNSGAVVNGNVQLDIGKTGDVIEVAAAAVAVDTSRQTVDSIITEKEIKQLPLFSRNFLDLAVLSPGVFVRDGNSIDPTKTFAYRAVGIDGKSGTGTRVQMDGIDVTDETVGTTVANVSQEAVNQFQLTRSSLDISTSLTASGAVNIITNSGSNLLHGSLFFDYFNQDMGARLGYQSTASDFNRKRSGGSVGFPLKKDKLFGYLNYEETWQNTQSIVNIPQFPGFNTVQPFPTKVKYGLARLDWNATQSIRIFYKLNHDDNLSTGGSALSPYQNVDNTNVHTVGFDYNRAHATNSVRFGYTNFNNRINSQELNTQFLRVNGSAVQLNVGPVGWGPNGLAPQATFQDNWQASYDGSYLWKKHTFRYGFAFTHIRLGGFANFAGPLAVNGTYDAGTIASLQASGVNIQDPQNFPLDSFSLGPQNGFFTLQGCDGYAHGCHKNNRTAAFVGDNIKLMRHLTLNLGLRFEYDSGYFNNEGVPRDPILETWGRGYSQTPQAPKFWNPSFGFAWDPKGDGKTAIRGGIYRNYEMNIFNNLIFDEFMMLPPGIGPDSYDNTFISGPDGTPLNVDGKHPDGDYSELVGQPIKNVLPFITQINGALQSAYNNYKFDPKVGKPDLEILHSDFDGIFPGNQFKAPYAIQMNIGVQRQLWADTVLTVDYIYNHGVGGPFLLNDKEMRHDASTLNATAARNRVNTITGGTSVDQYLSTHPTATMATFGLGSDTYFTGLTPTYQYMRFLGGGYSKYSALQFNLRGRLKSAKVAKDMSYNVSYSRGSSQATNGSSRTEFLATPQDNHNPNNPLAFGPTGLDYRHILGAGVVMRVPGGLQLNTAWTFRTPPAQTLTVPNILSATSSSNAIFSTDLNGDGGTGAGAPRGDNMPGIGAGGFGRKVDSIDSLNQALSAFNQTYAGKLTPAGQALVNAGIFTQAQVVALKGVTPTIPLVPAGNPNPWHNIFTTDLRVTRPISIKEKWRISPFADIINLFNHAPMATYAGLTTVFGSLNFDYTKNTPGSAASDLALARGRVSGTRQVQVGIRLDF